MATISMGKQQTQSDEGAAPGIAARLADDQVGAYASSGFAPHGAMQVYRQGAVLRCEARGPFNAEFMRAYARMWAAHRKDWIRRGPLVIHTVWSGSMLTSPDGLKLFRLLMERASRQLPARTLHLWTAAPDIEGRSLMLPFWHGVLREFGLRSQDCSDETQAQAAIEAFLREPPASAAPGTAEAGSAEQLADVRAGASPD